MPENDQEDAQTYEVIVVLMSQHAEGGSQSLLGETLGSMILDSGGSRSVCGLKWFNCYFDTLPTELRKRV